MTKIKRARRDGDDQAGKAPDLAHDLVDLTCRHTGAGVSDASIIVELLDCAAAIATLTTLATYEQIVAGFATLARERAAAAVDEHRIVKVRQRSRRPALHNAFRRASR